MTNHGEDMAERMAVLETKQIAQEVHNKKIEMKVDAMYEVVMTLKVGKYLSWVFFAAIGYAVHTFLPFWKGN